MLVANSEIWKSHLNIREGLDYLGSNSWPWGEVKFH